MGLFAGVVAVLPLHYLPSVRWFALALQASEIRLEAHENYSKQSYRNRCYIRTAAEVARLTVPVQHAASKQAIRAVKIDYSQRWAPITWRSLETAYRRTPFYEHYAPYLEPHFRQPPVYLFDLNLDLLTTCLQLLRLKLPVTLTPSWQAAYEPPIIDLRNAFSSKWEALANVPGAFPYTQHFGLDFVPDLSILDLLFCEGPGALAVLRQSYLP